MPPQPLVQDYRLEHTQSKSDNGLSIIIGQHRLPRQGVLSYQELFFSVHGQADVDPDQFQEYLLSQHVLPMYDERADTVPTLAQVQQIFNRRVPKVLPVHDETDPDEAVPIDAAATGIGDLDTALLWRPDAMNISVYRNMGKPRELYKHHGVLGWLESTAYRPGPNNKVRFQESIRTNIRRGVDAGTTPCVVVWVLTMPPPNALDATQDQTRPQNNEFAHLDFLAPPKSPLMVKDDQVQVSTMADYQHWAIQRVVEGTSKSVNIDLYLRLHARGFYPRSVQYPEVQKPGMP